MNKRQQVAVGCWLLLIAAALTACGADRVRDGRAAERLDTASGVTLRTDLEPMVFARAELRYSRSGRDYLYLGPVETNRQGTYEYYLWVGVASTLDRGYLAPPAEAPAKLFAVVQGELMELPLAPWAEREPTLARVDLYKTAVPVPQPLAARVTLEQLRLLADAGLADVRLADSNGDSRLYSRWDPKAWTQFFAGANRGGR
jgi:hypothetical protein